MAGSNSSKVVLLAELPGLEAAKQAIDARIAEIRRLVYGDYQTEQSQIRRRRITEETREQRRQFLAKARAAKLERLAARKKAELGMSPPDEKRAVTVRHKNEQVAPALIAAHAADKLPKKPIRKRK